MNTEDVVFSDMIESLQMGVFRCAIGDAYPQFVFLNSRLKSLLGLPPNRSTNVEFFSIFADQKKAKTFFTQVLEDGSSRSELELKGRGRKKFWASVSAVIVRDKQGRNTYLDGTVDDISQRKNLEKESLESKELFKTV